ncbi:hypothetical protein V6N12_012168 [Hibiscus sabdariffa]|uniref:Uncharacterized protein n=1 Tax=Hibiscus sabdariffa TaxID=183260 RepID=A0ABR2CHB6_9ROSI
MALRKIKIPNPASFDLSFFHSQFPMVACSIMVSVLWTPSLVVDINEEEIGANLKPWSYFGPFAKGLYNTQMECFGVSYWRVVEVAGKRAHGIGAGEVHESRESFADSSQQTPARSTRAALLGGNHTAARFCTR